MTKHFQANIFELENIPTPPTKKHYELAVEIAQELACSDTNIKEVNFWLNEADKYYALLRKLDWVPPHPPFSHCDQN